MLILTLVVLAEIILFQFTASLANTSLVRQELRAAEREVPATLTAHARRATRVRISLGVVLVGLALVPLTGLLDSSTAGKLLLTGVSITSGVAFALALVQDQRIMRRVADLYPGGSVRRASLERRSLGQWYHPALEAVPIGIFVATALFLVSTPGVFTADAVVPGDHYRESRTHTLVLVALQGLFVFGSLYHTVRKGVDVGSMATFIPSLRKRPDVALKLGEQLAGTQAKYFMFAKIAVTSLLGASIVEKILDATGRAGASFWDIMGWSIVGLLLVGFFFYLRKVGNVSRRMQQEMELTNHHTANAG